MAQTRRKRQTKHRGNAAGFVESRGRTGRKPTAAEKSGNAAEAAKAKKPRVDPRDQPPTWRGAALRALVAACALALLCSLMLKASPAQTVLYFAIGLIAYTPVSYYTDSWIFKRRQRKNSKQRGGKEDGQ